MMFQRRDKKKTEKMYAYESATGHIEQSLRILEHQVEIKTNEQNKIRVAKIDLINYYMKLIRLEMGTGARTLFLRSGEGIKYDVMPKHYLDKQGNKKGYDYYQNGRNIKRLPLNLETIIVPAKINKVVSSYLYFRNKTWEYDPLNHFGTYYEELGLLIISQGLHSSSTFVNLQKEAYIDAHGISIKPLLNDIYTDGEWWRGTEDKAIEKVKDVRMAILFYLAKLKQNIQEGENYDK